MKKICHLTSAHPRSDTRVFIKECRSLAEAGFEVSLIVADDKGDEEKQQIQIFDVGKEKSRYKRMLLTARKVYKKAIIIDADIYHFHDPDLLHFGKKLLKKGKKVIYDVHEDYPQQILSKPYLPIFIRPLFSAIFKKFENRIAKKMSYILPATPFIKKRFIKLNKNTKDICNYPIINDFQNKNKEFSKQNAICYAGGISINRGIIELIKALEKTDTKLILAGDYKSSDLRNTLLKLPAWEKVDERGYVSSKEVAGILSASKIGIVTLKPLVNYITALPVKMFEYMSAGIPVIASDFELWKEIVEQNNCGICVNPESPDEIADAINTILNDDNLAGKMGKAGRKAVENKYNWANEKKKLVEVYNKLINS